jgi:hypothetical protein
MHCHGGCFLGEKVKMDAKGMQPNKNLSHTCQIPSACSAMHPVIPVEIVNAYKVLTYYGVLRGQINKQKRRGSNSQCSHLQPTARSPGYAARIGAVLVQSCSSAVHVQSRKSKDPNFALHLPLWTCAHFCAWWHSNNQQQNILQHVQPPTNCTRQQQWHHIAPNLTTLQPSGLQALL